MLFSFNVSATPVNINTANAGAISNALKGIGPKKAAEIIRYRSKNGAFKSLNDLINVKGIGQKTIDKNAKDILFSGKGTTKKPTSKKSNSANAKDSLNKTQKKPNAKESKAMETKKRASTKKSKVDSKKSQPAAQKKKSSDKAS